MKKFSGRITFDYEVKDVANIRELDEKLDTLIDLLSRRSNDLEGVNWENVNWTVEEEEDE